jgi:hypothetical protein
MQAWIAQTAGRSAAVEPVERRACEPDYNGCAVRAAEG